MREEIKKRFCSHRGDISAGPENSYKSIKAGLAKEPPYVEIDVVLVDGIIIMGHGREKEQYPLKKVLPLFQGKKTFPKIDIKIGKDDKDKIRLIDAVLDVVIKAGLGFVLLTLSSPRWHLNLTPEDTMRLQRHIAGRIRGNPRIKFNVDPVYLRPAGEPIDDRSVEHVRALGDVVYAISPEIKWEDLDAMGKFAHEHGIRYVCFWLFGPPDDPNCTVSEATLLKTLELEKRYGVKVLFDMDQRYVTS